MIIYTRKKDKGLDLSLEQKSQIANYIERIKKDTEISIEIKRVYKGRTNPQNRLYWFWLNIIGDELGYQAEELHDSYKAMFLTDRKQKIPLVRSTTALDTKQYTIFLELVKKHSETELGILLPDTLDSYIEFESNYKIN